MARLVHALKPIISRNAHHNRKAPQRPEGPTCVTLKQRVSHSMTCFEELLANMIHSGVEGGGAIRAVRSVVVLEPSTVNSASMYQHAMPQRKALRKRKL